MLKNLLAGLGNLALMLIYVVAGVTLLTVGLALVGVFVVAIVGVVLAVYIVLAIFGVL